MTFKFRPLALFFLMFGFISLVALHGTALKVIGAMCLLVGIGMSFSKRHTTQPNSSD